MNCFFITSQTLVFLKKGLSPTEQKEFEAHLTHCKACDETIKKQTLLIEEIKLFSAPPIQEHLLEPSSFLNVSLKKRIPRPYRNVLKLMLSFTLMGLLMSWIPKIGMIRTFQAQNSVKSGLEWLFPMQTITNLISPTENPLSSQVFSPHQSTNETLDVIDDEDPEGQITVVTPSKKAQRMQSELLRFICPTIHPEELQAKIKHTLHQFFSQNGLKIEIQGGPIPGGIEFDFSLKTDLVERLKPVFLSEINPYVFQNAMKTYKIKSRRTLPPGESQILIWISQPGPWSAQTKQP